MNLPPQGSKIQLFLQMLQCFGSFYLANSFPTEMEEAANITRRRASALTGQREVEADWKPSETTMLLCSPATWTNLEMSGCLVMENLAIPQAVEIMNYFFQPVSCVGSVTPNTTSLHSKRQHGDFSTTLLGWGNVLITKISPPPSDWVGTANRSKTC